MLEIFSIGLGLIFGSFANVLVFRLPQKESVVFRPSYCPECQKSILWKDKIPLLSYLFLGGRCRFCKKKIALRYFLIEMLGGLFFWLAFLHTGWSPLLWFRIWPMLVLFLAIAFIDFEHRIIPDELNLIGWIIGMGTSWMVSGGWVSCLLGSVFGFGMFYLLAWAYFALRNQSGLGGGDIKFLGMLGAFLGSQGVLVTVVLSSLLGSAVGIVFACIQKEQHWTKTSLPFGPFLIFGALSYYFFGDSVWLKWMMPI
jgi:leader peptidase (prepilin peptidase)/N-methyltransferase